jgi:hypothetical protein
VHPVRALVSEGRSRGFESLRVRKGKAGPTRTRLPQFLPHTTKQPKTARNTRKQVPLCFLGDFSMILVTQFTVEDVDHRDFRLDHLRRHHPHHRIHGRACDRNLVFRVEGGLPSMASPDPRKIRPRMLSEKVTCWGCPRKRTRASVEIPLPPKIPAGSRCRDRARPRWRSTPAHRAARRPPDRRERPPVPFQSADARLTLAQG